MPGTRIRFEQGFLNHPITRTHDDVIVIDVIIVAERLDINDRPDGIARLDADQVLDGPSFGGLGAFGNLVHFQPKQLSVFRENHQVIEHRRREKVRGKVRILGLHTPRSYPTPRLGSVLLQRRSFNIAFAGNGDEHFLVGDHVLVAEFLGGVLDRSAAVVAVALAYFGEFGFNDFKFTKLISQNVPQIGNQRHDLLIFLNNLVPFKSG